MATHKYTYALLSLIVLLCSCEPLLVPQSGTQDYEIDDVIGHKYVDLGLSVKWAAYNIGANSAAEFGYFFAWGETEPKPYGFIGFDTYKFSVPKSGENAYDDGHGNLYQFTKYNTDYESEYYDGKTTLELIDDAAHMAWGGNWRMPTADECRELVEKCEWNWTRYQDMLGYDVKGPNGNRIFLPNREAAGLLEAHSYDDYPDYHSSTKDSHSDYVSVVMASSGHISSTFRSSHFQVRAVYDKALPKFSILSFDANGGEGLMHPQQFNKGVCQNIDAVRYTNGILNFVGWNTAPDGSGQSFANGQEITLDKNTTLYAQWALATGSENGYDYVDLGLPSGAKWAIYNVGATSPEAYGDYFAWGETEPKDSYSWENYKYGSSEKNLTKYQTAEWYYTNVGYVDDRMELELIDDAAQANWGGNWRMPSLEEYEELCQYCTFTWASFNGVEGTLVTSKLNQNRIFLPAAGYWRENQLLVEGLWAGLWTRSKDSRDVYEFIFIRTTSSIHVNSQGPDPYIGNTVRPIFNEEIPPYYQVTFDANGGEGSMSSREYYEGESKSLPLCRYTHSASEFLAWNTAPDGSGTSYTDGQELTLTQDITLYAQWESAGGSGGGSSTSGTENGHEWVDLGLPSGLKWATCNIGATAPEGYGDYFAWGETSPKDNYEWGTYKYCNGSETTLTKYNTKSSKGTVDNKTTLDISDDAARANWGGKWRMPTQAEQEELINNCTWTWITQSGVNGYKVTSNTNGNSIFLPAAGCRFGTSVYYAGFYGCYWSSSLYESFPSYACYLHFNSGYVDWNYYDRNYGHTVRAVCP